MRKYAIPYTQRHAPTRCKTPLYSCKIPSRKNAETPMFIVCRIHALGSMGRIGLMKYDRVKHVASYV